MSNVKNKTIKNITLLSMTQALNGSNQGIVLAVGALAGASLAPDPVLATLPITIMILGLALNAIPATYIIHRFQRKTGFMLGAAIAALAGFSASYAIAVSSFLMFCIALGFVGASASFAQQYRFAAADSVDDKWKPRAISFVLLGGVFAGFLGPNMAFFAKDLVSNQQFSGSFLLISGMAFLTMILLSFSSLAPTAKASKSEGEGRSIKMLIRSPSIFVPVICAMTTYALMIFVMVAAPLAMVSAYGHDVQAATTSIQWHIVAMFGPSFATGFIINRIGTHVTVAIGMIFVIMSALVALSGTSQYYFYGALVLLGLGWNFGFIGSTTMLSTAYSKSEAARAQALNEQIVFGAMAISSIGSGAVLQLVGWRAVNMISIPVAIFVIILLIWGFRQHNNHSKKKTVLTASTISLE
ncbi:Uncharacterized MFS-type transporter [hydrothermal vent metagenome]|uniref:Uncharacterized MFS-type transporter n=1 Tax=hydrothermal vent metagenome TaxID=652676 RepID=A0A3B0UYT1_9ZZZZ